MARSPQLGVVIITLNSPGIIESFDEGSGELLATFEPSSTYSADTTGAISVSNSGGLLVASRRNDQLANRSGLFVCDPMTLEILAQLEVPGLSPDATPLFTSDETKVITGVGWGSELIEWNLGTDERRSLYRKGWESYIGDVSIGQDLRFVTTTIGVSCSCVHIIDLTLEFSSCSGPYWRDSEVAGLKGESFARFSDNGYYSQLYYGRVSDCYGARDLVPVCQLSPSGNWLLRNAVLFNSDDTTTMALNCGEGCDSTEESQAVARFNSDESMVFAQFGDSPLPRLDVTRGLYSTKTGELVHDLTPQEQSFREIGLNGTGTRLYSPVEPGRIQVWDTESGERVADIRYDSGPARYYNQFTLDPTERLFAFADYYSRSVLVFSTTESSKSTVVPFDSEALAISFSGDGNRLAIMEKSLIRVYDTSSGMPEGLALQNVLTRPQYDATQFDSMAFSADGATLAVATTAKPSGYLFELVIFDLNSGEPVRMTRMTNQGNQLQYSPDGERLLVTGLDRSWFVTIRDAQTLNVIARFATSGEDTTFDGTGDLVLAYSTGDSIPLDAYDWRTGLRVFRDYPLYRYDVSFHDVRAAAGSDSVYACTSNAIYRLKLPDACDSGGSAPLRKLLGIDQACEPKDLNSDGVLDTADFVAWSLAP